MASKGRVWSDFMLPQIGGVWQFDPHPTKELFIVGDIENAVISRIYVREIPRRDNKPNEFMAAMVMNPDRIVVWCDSCSHCDFMLRHMARYTGFNVRTNRFQHQLSRKERVNRRNQA